MNYSSSDPLFDAWIAYHPLPSTTISNGQKQTFANNREMTLSESTIVRGDYLMEIYRDRVKISDVNNNYKLVATLTFYLNTIKFREQIIEHIVEELVNKVY